MSDRKLALTLAFNGTGNLSTVMRRMIGEGGAAAASLRGLNTVYRQQKTELRELQERISKVGVPTRQMVEDQRRLEHQIERTTAEIEQQRKATERQGRAESMGSAAREAGTKNVAVGTGIAAGLFAVGKISADFQDGMTDIQQKADLSAKATAMMQKNIMLAARDAKQLPESMRAGVDVLAGFGMDPQQATKMIAPIGRAATAYRAEISDLAAASFANFSNLKVPVDQTTGAINAMAMAGKMGAFEMKDMAMYFPALTAQAESFGQKGVGAVSDLAAALQIARTATGDSATAANNVQNLLAKINATDTIDKFKKGFGIDLPAAMKKAEADGKTPLEAIAELTNKALGGDLKKLPLLFGDMQAQSALRPLIQNLGEYRRIRAEALKASQAAPGKGVIDADFALRAQNANVQARALTGNLITVAMIMGQRLLPTFVALSDRLLKLSERFEAWAEKNPGAVDMIVKMVVALAGLNLGLGAARIAFGSIVGPATSAFSALKWLRTFGIEAGAVAEGAPLLIGAFGGIGAAATVFGESMAAAGAFLLANPIILVITAIVAALVIAVPWIIKNWSALSAGFQAFGASLMQSFAPVIGPVTEFVHFLSSIWDRIKGPLMAGIQNAATIFMNFTPQGWILKGIMALFTWLRGLDWSGLGKMMIQGMIDGILFMLGPLGAVFKKAAGAGIDAFKAKAQIHSPSRVFMGFGDNIAEGLSIGMQRSMQDPMRAARAMAAGVAGAMAISTPAIAGEALPTIKTMAQISAPTASVSPGQAAVHVGNITINVNATPDQKPNDIAAEVMRLFRAETDRLQAKNRSAYRDEEN